MRYARIDWPRLILELQGSGLRVTQITAALSVRHASICRLRDDNAEPLHRNGEQLVALYRERLRAEPPRK